MTPEPHGQARIEYPNDLEIVITREFEAPIGLVFDVFTKLSTCARHSLRLERR
jgi:uncharacterized protein YndB with AHSA1/START domain